MTTILWVLLGLAAIAGAVVFSGLNTRNTKKTTVYFHAQSPVPPLLYRYEFSEETEREYCESQPPLITAARDRGSHHLIAYLNGADGVELRRAGVWRHHWLRELEKRAMYNAPDSETLACAQSIVFILDHLIEYGTVDLWDARRSLEQLFPHFNPSGFEEALRKWLKVPVVREIALT